MSKLTDRISQALGEGVFKKGQVVHHRELRRAGYEDRGGSLGTTVWRHPKTKHVLRTKWQGKSMREPSTMAKGYVVTNEGTQVRSTTEASEVMVNRIVHEVEGYLGDVITQEMSPEEAYEECWTLCIDKANDIFGFGNRQAIPTAREACIQLGYTPPGFKEKDSPATRKYISREELSPGGKPEREVKPTGVHHAAYRPNMDMYR